MDETDQYLSRSLKNWAEKQKSHARSRESLLRLAAADPILPKTNAAVYTPISMDEYRCQQRFNRFSGTYLRGSFTLSMAWPVDLAILIRPTL